MDGTAQQWYVAVGGQTSGPATAEQIGAWAREGRLPPGWLVCEVGQSQWQAPESVPALAYLVVGAPLARGPAPFGACPHCGGGVRNVAPVYGWPWGFWQRALKAQFQCDQCRRDIPLAQLDRQAREAALRARKIGWISWAIIVFFVFAAIASPFLMILLYKP